MTSFLNQPESEFNVNSTNASRCMTMWITPYCLIFEHKGRYRGVPLTNVVEFE